MALLTEPSMGDGSKREPELPLQDLLYEGCNTGMSNESLADVQHVASCIVVNE